MTDRLLTPEELSELLGVPVRTLSDWRYRGIGPAYEKHGKHVRYSESAVNAYRRSRRRTGGGASERGAA